MVAPIQKHSTQMIANRIPTNTAIEAFSPTVSRVILKQNEVIIEPQIAKSYRCYSKVISSGSGHTVDHEEPR